MVDCWSQLGIVPYDHMICSTPIFRLWLGVTEYLFRKPALLEEVIRVAIEDISFRSDDLEFTFAARGWSDCVTFGDFKSYKDRFLSTQKFFEKRFPEATKVGQEMIATILENTKNRATSRADYGNGVRDNLGFLASIGQGHLNFKLCNLREEKPPRESGGHELFAIDHALKIFPYLGTPCTCRKNFAFLCLKLYNQQIEIPIHCKCGRNRFPKPNPRTNPIFNGTIFGIWLLLRDLQTS